MPSDTPIETSSPGSARPVIPAPVVSALGRFRVVSLIESIALLILVVLMLVEYVFDGPKLIPFWTQIHGFIFFAYFLLTLDLGYKARWKPLSTLVVIVAGCIPFVSFYAEHRVNTAVRAGRRL